MPELRIEIDKMRLDDEWSGQPLQIYNWSKEVAEAQLAFDNAKVDLNLTEAELNREIRDNPSVYGLDKVTDKAIEATIYKSTEYVAAQKAVNNARYNLGIANAAVNSLEHRKRAMTMLVELFIREYYSDGSGRMSEADRAEIYSRGRRRVAEDRNKVESEDV